MPIIRSGNNIKFTPNSTIVTDDDGRLTVLPDITPDDVSTLENASDVGNIGAAVGTNANDIETNATDIEANAEAISNLSNNNIETATRYMVIPNDAYWQFTRITLGEYDVQINTSRSVTIEDGIDILNLGSKRFYITCEYTYSTATSNPNTPEKYIFRNSIPAIDSLVIMDNVDIRVANAITFARIVLSSYGSAAEISESLVIELNIVRFNASNHTWISKAYLI